MADKTKVISIFEAFAGIGAQRKALTNIKTNYKVAGLAEWYVPAIISYQAIHNKRDLSILEPKINLTDIIHYLERKTLSMDSKTPVKPGYWKRHKDLSKITIIYNAVKFSEAEGNIFDVRRLHKRKLIDVDLLTYSFPCQDLSQQGKQRGMAKGSGTRSGLLWEIEKALDATPKNKLPKYLLMENVLSLTYKNNKKDLDQWIKKLDSLGYKSDLQKLNSSDFGSPQARRRAFMISTLKKKISLPIYNNNNKKSIKDILEPTREKDMLSILDRYDRTDFKETKSWIKKSRLPLEYTTFNSEAYIYDPEYHGPTLTASGANSRIKILLNNRIRKISPMEAYKYMGFKSNDFDKVNRLGALSEAKMIYTCGNSISVEVLESIFMEVLNG